MKRSKKWLGVVMAAVMMGSVAVPVLAAETDPNAPQPMNVKYNEPNVYQITIPGEVTLGTAETTATISATKMNIAPGKMVKVTVQSGLTNGAVTLTREKSTDTTTSTVSLKPGGQAVVDSSTLAVAAFESQKTTAYVGGTLYFSALPSGLAAGDWTGQIVFSIELADK